MALNTTVSVLLRYSPQNLAVLFQTNVNFGYNFRVRTWRAQGMQVKLAEVRFSGT